jgi:two-component system, NtrC family, sensor kinase
LSSKFPQILPDTFSHYLIAIPAFFLAVYSTWNGDVFVSAGIVAIGCAALFTVRNLHKQIETSSEISRNLGNRLCREQSLSCLDELSSGIAHEINNPLAIMSQEIQFAGHILKSDEFQKIQQTEECAESLQVIEGEIQRCKDIVHKLTCLARNLDPVVQYVNLTDLINSIAQIVSRDAASKDIRIRMELGENPIEAPTDPPLLRQVLLNLLTNAAHAIGSNGVITVRAYYESKFVIISITDTGCGIPKENLDLIFTPFFSTKSQGKGSGLGLAISRGILQKIGGYLSVTSELGEGSTFRVHLPLQMPQN